MFSTFLVCIHKVSVVLLEDSNIHVKVPGLYFEVNKSLIFNEALV